VSKSNTFEQELLLLLFNNDAITLIGDAAGLLPSAAPGSLYVSFHTSDPGEAGDQTTNEITTGEYGQYARLAVARTTGGWTVADAGGGVWRANLTSAISGTVMSTGTGGTITHWGVGTDSSGAGKLLYKGTVTPNITMANGVTPQLGTGSYVEEQ